MNIKYIEIYKCILNILKKKKTFNGKDLLSEFTVRFKNPIIILNCEYLSFDYLTNENDIFSYTDENCFINSVHRIEYIDCFDFSEQLLYDFQQDHHGVVIENLDGLIFKYELEKELDKSENSCIMDETKPKRKM